MINNRSEANGVYHQLVESFRKLAGPSRLSVRYAAGALPTWVETIYSDPGFRIQSVAGGTKGVRVFANRYRTSKNEWYWVKPDGLVPEVDPATPAGPADPTDDGRRGLAEPVAEYSRVWRDETAGLTYVVADGNLFRMPSARYAPADWNW
ncbi:MAG: hypothetical protein JWO31_222 [Phycisphaerales bacterium]|nr:hypothetical protein [Phycisphaerales bacterium]